MNTKIVALHGGPYHGRAVEIPNMEESFTCEAVGEYNIKEFFETSALESLKVRTGTYSRIRGKFREFEWDGFQK